MSTYRFETPTPVELYAEIGKGDVQLTAAESDTTTVEVTGRDADGVVVEHAGDRISVITPRRRGLLPGEGSVHVVVSLPTGSDLVAKLGSADLRARGRYGSASIRSGSGDAHLDVVGGDAHVETGSGDLRVEEALGRLEVKSGSGDVTLGLTGGATSVSTGSGDVTLSTSGADTTLKTGSGDLRVGAAHGDVSATTGSGDVQVATATRGRITARVASGDVRVGVPAGTPVWTDVSTVSGSIRSTLASVGQPQEGQEHVELRARTVSGDIALDQV